MTATPQLKLVKDETADTAGAAGGPPANGAMPASVENIYQRARDEALASTAPASAVKQNGSGKIDGSTWREELLPPDPERYNDLANAARFLAVMGDDIKYCVEKKRWLIYDKTHWTWDREDVVFEYAKVFAAGLYETAGTKDALKNADRANNRSGFTAFLELAARERSVSIESFDRNAYLLNCRNGALDLRTGSLRPHSRNDLITRVVNADYPDDPDNLSGPNWEKFLATIQPNPDIRAFLQRSVGYSLLGIARERSFWILYGTGANGKSVFIDVLNDLLGEYACGTTSASIMAVRQTSSIPNDIARLKGKRFIIIPETEENERLNAALIKQLSAGDTVTARFLFGEFFDFQFTGKLWIATNHKPTITDHSLGFWDRLKLIPFATRIDVDKRIPKDELHAMLLAEAPAILAWAVRGCRDYYDLGGLDVPDVIQREIDAYKFEQDSIAQFLNERCETYIDHIEGMTPDEVEQVNPRRFQTSNGELYKAYEKFCKENGEYQRSHRRFTQAMIERGFRQGKSNGRYWEGVRVEEVTGI